MGTKIYTRRGDHGLTDLANGDRVAKDDERIEINGLMDELNATIGLAKSKMPAEDSNRPYFNAVQELLMQTMSFIAGGGKFPANYGACTKAMEQTIDRMSNDEPFKFLVPGSSEEEAILHLCRARTRTIERRLCSLSRKQPLPVDMLQFFNRLSDYFYALALCLQQ